MKYSPKTLNLIGLLVLVGVASLLIIKLSGSNSVSQNKVSDTAIGLVNTTAEPTFTDDNKGENIIIKTDKGTYSGGSDIEVHFSLANESNIPQNLHVQFYFPQDIKVGLYALQHKTENGWEDVQLSSTLLPQPLLYKNTKPIPDNLEVKNSFDFYSTPGASDNFRVVASFENSSRGEFWVEAIGDKGAYGLLDPGFLSDIKIRGGGNSTGYSVKIRGGSSSRAIAFVSGQKASTNDSTTPGAVVTLPNNPTAGNFVVCAATVDASGAVSSVADGNSNSYTKTTNSPSTNASSNSAYIWYLTNAPANASKTINFTWSSGSNFQAWCAEFSGVKTTSPLETDAINTFGANSTNINDPSVTTTNNGDLLVGAAIAQNTIASLNGGNSPWTGIDVPQNGNYAEYYVQPTAGAQAISFTQNSAGSWTSIEAAFKVGSASGPNIKFR